VRMRTPKPLVVLILAIGLLAWHGAIAQEAAEVFQGEEVEQFLLKARVALGSDERADLEAALYDLNSVSRQLTKMVRAKSTAEKAAEGDGQKGVAAGAPQASAALDAAPEIVELGPADDEG